MVTQLNTPLNSDYFSKRAAVQTEINRNKIEPVNTSRRSFHEKKELKLAKKEYNKLKNTQKFLDDKNSILHQIMSTELPKWGSIKLTLLK